MAGPLGNLLICEALGLAVDSACDTRPSQKSRTPDVVCVRIILRRAASLRVIRVACAVLALALLSPGTQAAPQAPAATEPATPESKASDTVARIRQLAVEIERETAPRDVERRKFNELKSLIDAEAIAQFVL